MSLMFFVVSGLPVSRKHDFMLFCGCTVALQHLLKGCHFLWLLLRPTSDRQQPKGRKAYFGSRFRGLKSLSLGRQVSRVSGSGSRNGIISQKMGKHRGCLTSAGFFPFSFCIPSSTLARRMKLQIFRRSLTLSVNLCKLYHRYTPKYLGPLLSQASWQLRLTITE